MTIIIINVRILAMNIEKIKKAKTEKIGKKIEYFKEIASTHLYAKQIAQKEENDGKLIIAEVQTSGIGTKGRSWYTGKSKNIAMTIILHPKCKVSNLKNLTFFHLQKYFLKIPLLL